MKKAYITNASLKLILKSLRGKLQIKREEAIAFLSKELKDILSFNEINNIFNNDELRDLYLLNGILTDFDSFLENIKENKEIITNYINFQNEKYIKKIKVPAYHIDYQCKWMKSDFYNIEIPTEYIKDKNMEIKIKDWIEKNRYKKFPELNQDFIKEFNFQKGLEQVNIKNSGFTDVDYQNLLKIKDDIKIKYKQLTFDFDNEDYGKIIQRIKYMPFFRLSEYLTIDHNKESHPYIEKFHNDKYILKKVILQFFQEKYNQELSFDGSILDMIGFRSCRRCSS